MRWYRWCASLLLGATTSSAFSAFTVRPMGLVSSAQVRSEVRPKVVENVLNSKLAQLKLKNRGVLYMSDVSLVPDTPVLDELEGIDELEDAESALVNAIAVQDQNLLERMVTKLRNLDVNEVVNTGIIVMVAALVLTKLGTVDQGLMRGWTASEMAVRIPLDNWADYSEVLSASPLQTKAVTSATVYTIGDIIAQRTEGKSMGNLDRMRVVRSLLAGLIGHGPLSHVWYDVSEEFFNYLHWDQWWSFFPKVLVDQATWGPFWNNTYILLLGLMKMESFEKIFGDMKRTTIPLIVSGLKLWPLAHAVTYGLIPVENRLLWVDMVEILWVIILATSASEASSHGAPAPADDSVSDGPLAEEKSSS